jgi:uncharacterized protein YjiS (DUF1127 family)
MQKGLGKIKQIDRSRLIHQGGAPMPDHIVADAPRPSRARAVILFGRWLMSRLLRADAAYRDLCVLESLDDRTLRDIGVTQAEMEHEFRRLDRERRRLWRHDTTLPANRSGRS